MFRCGFNLAFCKLVLATLDSTRSVVCAGKLASRSFKETRGTRKGAVESPHQFNVYIDGLRHWLEEEHPRLCKLMGCIIAVLLYADDAALPADSAEDLQIAASIAETFFNDSQLFVSTSKTFLTVFHNKTDQGVTYRNDSVQIDGMKSTCVSMVSASRRCQPSNTYV